MKRLGAILLTFTTLFTMLTFTGCKGPVTDAEAVDILIPLLEQDVELNRYVWGDGFTTREDPGEDAKATDSCKYYRVNEDAPYHSTNQLRAAIEDVYSTLLSVTICAYAFENNDESMARFCDFMQNDAVGDLQIDVTLNHPPYELKTVLYPNTATVKRSTTTIIEAEVEYSIGMDGAHEVMTIRLLKQNGKWKLDTHTWAGQVA